MTKSSEYWKSRAEAITAGEHTAADVTLSKLEKTYKEAEQSIKKEISSWYGKFADNNEITIQTAKKWLNKNELKEFRWDVDKYIKYASDAGLSAKYQKELVNASARVHISRLEAVQTHINHQLEMLHNTQNTQMINLGKSVISDAYGRTAFATFQGLGYGWDITTPNGKVLDELLKTPWTTDGKTFSDRIWENKRKLVANTQKTLIQSVLRGDSQQQMTEALMKLMGSSRYNAGRLMHTETTYFCSLADKKVYEDLGVDEVEIIATLDEVTCPVCGAMDGTLIPFPQYEAGVSVPPFHPNCRCTTAPAIDDYGVTGERIARNADGKTYNVPADMTYEEWKTGTYKPKVAPKETPHDNNGGNIKQGVNIVKTVEEAKDALVKVVGFNRVGNGVSKINDKLFISITNQLVELESKFNSVHKSTGIVDGVSERGNTIAYVSRKVAIPSEQSLYFNEKYYRDRKSFIEMEMNEVKSGHSMPCSLDDNELMKYTVTHEYGHILQNQMLQQYFVDNGWDANNPFSKIDKTKKTQKARWKWYYKTTDELQKQHFDEIISYAKNIDSSFLLSESLSEYGHTNRAEFFAECFANSQLSKPNVLGKAMKEFLKKRGY